MGWIDNKDLFVKYLKQGHEAQEKVASALRDLGYEAITEPLQIRANVSQISNFKKTFDVLVMGKKLEVKGRDLFFTHSGNLPYKQMLVDTVDGWDAKDPSTIGEVLVSRVSGAMLYLSAKTKPEWKIVKNPDNKRQIKEVVSYAAPRHLYKPIDHIRFDLTDEKEEPTFRCDYCGKTFPGHGVLPGIIYRIEDPCPGTVDDLKLIVHGKEVINEVV